MLFSWVPLVPNFARYKGTLQSNVRKWCGVYVFWTLIYVYIYIYTCFFWVTSHCNQDTSPDVEVTVWFISRKNGSHFMVCLCGSNRYTKNGRAPTQWEVYKTCHVGDSHHRFNWMFLQVIKMLVSIPWEHLRTFGRFFGHPCDCQSYQTPQRRVQLPKGELLCQCNTLCLLCSWCSCI